MIVPISKSVIEPILRSNITYVDSIEEFEKLELQPNETRLAFDNNRQCFYIKSRDRLGKYSSVKIFFYNDFAQTSQFLQREEFLEKCRKVGLSEVDTKIAEKAFFDNMKNEDLWDWLLRNKIKDVSLDTIRTIKWRIRVKLCPELIKHRNKKV